MIKSFVNKKSSLEVTSFVLFKLHQMQNYLFEQFFLLKRRKVLIWNWLLHFNSIQKSKLPNSNEISFLNYHLDHIILHLKPPGLSVWGTAFIFDWLSPGRIWTHHEPWRGTWLFSQLCTYRWFLCHWPCTL